jgi:hypothetical protein
MDGNAPFGGAAAVFAKAQTVTDHLFVASDGGLNPAAFGTARHLLPADPAFLCRVVSKSDPARSRCKLAGVVRSGDRLHLQE